jgi:hypothetical protein
MLPPTKPMTKEEIQALKANLAYSYAFGDSPGSWSGIGWLLTNGVAKVAYLIPVAGYFVLYSDYFQGLAQFSVLSPAKGFLTFKERAHLLYFGSLMLLFVYAIYYGITPKPIRNKTSLHQFVTDVLSSRDHGTVRQVLSESISHLESIEMQALSEPERAKLEHLLRDMKMIDAQPTFMVSLETAIAESLRFYYNWKTNTDPKGADVVLFFTFISYGMLLAPAVDLFARIMQAITGIHFLTR